MKGIVLWGLALLCVATWACRPSSGTGGDGDGDADSDGDSDADGPVTCTPGEIVCQGNVARTCNGSGDGWLSSEECVGDTPACMAGRGCVFCVPNARECHGNDVMSCNAEGTAWDFVMTCGEGDSCMNGRCTDPCSEAEANNSYEGCEYRAVTLMNSGVSPDFVPAIVVGNRNAQAAEITVTRGGSHVASATVAPNSTQTIELPWVNELKQQLSDPEAVEQSTNVPDGSYRVVSTLPVTVYQFNPLEYGLPRDCAQGDVMPGDGECYSYSNDASLLLPVHVLTEHYIVMSRPNLAIVNHVVDPIWGDSEDIYSFSPSTLAVVNPQDHQVTVEIQFSSPTQAGPGLTAYETGQTGTFDIAPGGVLQIAARLPESCVEDFREPTPSPCGTFGEYECTYGYCNARGYDLTGTEISASAPVAVFGSHNCTFIPFNRWACDHLEEQLFPYETWGKHFVVAQSHRENGEPDVWRILSGADNNTIRFNPGSVHGEVRLNRGEHVEFEARGAFEIISAEPILVGQFLVGQNYNDFDVTESPPGDPGFALAVPSEQWRSAYNFLAPSSYDRSYVNITTTEAGRATIQLDGANLSGEPWERIGDSEFYALRREIAPGSHGITASATTSFGITVYGYGQFTSYMYPGGLDLEQIAIW